MLGLKAVLLVYDKIIRVYVIFNCPSALLFMMWVQSLVIEGLDTNPYSARQFLAGYPYSWQCLHCVGMPDSFGGSTLTMQRPHT